MGWGSTLSCVKFENGGNEGGDKLPAIKLHVINETLKYFISTWSLLLSLIDDMLSVYLPIRY